MLGETLVERDESFVVTLSTPAEAAIDTASAVGTIRNDDSAFALQTFLNHVMVTDWS